MATMSTQQLPANLTSGDVRTVAEAPKAKVAAPKAKVAATKVVVAKAAAKTNVTAAKVAAAKVAAVKAATNAKVAVDKASAAQLKAKNLAGSLASSKAKSAGIAKQKITLLSRVDKELIRLSQLKKTLMNETSCIAPKCIAPKCMGSEVRGCRHGARNPLRPVRQRRTQYVRTCGC